MIRCELVKGIYDQKKKVKSSKLAKLWKESFSSDSEESRMRVDDSVESDNSALEKFNEKHNFEAIFEPIQERDKLIIEVEDTGIGIKKCDIVKLFKLFSTLSNTRQMNTQGIGLGLVISENIVQAF